MQSLGLHWSALTKAKKLLILGLSIGLILLVVGFVTISLINSRKNDPMTFEVTIPGNTPADDTVHINIQGLETRKMTKKSDLVYTISIPAKDLPEKGEKIDYRYSRNGYDFATAEYMEPDTNDFFWTKRGRTVESSPGGVQSDSIARWRWFPADSQPIIATSPLEPEGTFLIRTNNLEFRSGQIIEDLYHKSYDDFFDSTAKHMQKTGYNWVEIAPPWQWTEDENGLPKVENLSDKNPNYPTDEKFLEEVRAYKKQGLKVAIQPQICCNELTLTNRSDQWWDQYFEETTKFLIHFAKLADQADADAMHYAIGSEEIKYKTEWAKVFAEIRKNFSGQVGQMVWSFGDKIGQIIPQAEQISWGDALDYFQIAIDAPVSRIDNPTDAQLKSGADKILDGAKSLYDRYKKPVVVRTTYFNIVQTWKGSGFYSIADVPWQGSEEKELTTGKYKFSNTDQARTINAYFRSIAERPWIVGYLQFGYGHWENPLSSELSVRGKPSEAIWQKWNQTIKSSDR